MNETIIGTIEKLVAGGDGILRDADGAVFVPYVVPGEKISARIVSAKGRTRFAVADKIIEPSSDRVEPPCEYFGECGGCQWQHISYEAQLKHKAAIVAESLSWIGKITTEIDEIVPSPAQFGYRSRIRLHAAGKKIGYFSEGSKKLIPITNCMLAVDSINKAFASLKRLPTLAKEAEIELMDNKECVVAIVKSRDDSARFRLTDGDWVEDNEIPAGFTQVNPAQNNNLKKIVRVILRSIKPKRVIELFAGNGNITLDIIKVANSILAVDSDREAIRSAIERFGGEQGVKFVTMESAHYVAKGIKDGEKPDMIVLDPPRTGAKECLDGIVALNPANIVYISCDPATLARDLKALSAKYKVDRVSPVDMFPQTSHIESVALLSRA